MEGIRSPPRSSISNNYPLQSLLLDSIISFQKNLLKRDNFSSKYFEIVLTKVFFDHAIICLYTVYKNGSRIEWLFDSFSKSQNKIISSMFAGTIFDKKKCFRLAQIFHKFKTRYENRNVNKPEALPIVLT